MLSRVPPSLLFGGVVLLTLLLAACDLTGPEEGRVVEGVDFGRLFAAPTAAERAAVAQEWAARTASVQAYAEVAAETLLVQGTPVRLRVVSHEVDGLRHYGAVLAPAEAPPQSLPVLVYLHGGEAGLDVSAEVLPVLALLPAMSRGFVLVMPAFRSEPLTWRGTAYQSEGAPSPWDRDVDDAMALLQAAVAATPAADPARVGVVGFSRGATVGMLMGIRDPAVDLVAAFFGPTDFLGPFVQEVAEDALRGRPRDLPGFDVLNETYLQPLRRGTLSLEEVRLALIRRSPVYFAEHLPPLQIHHGTADAIVPVREARALRDVMQALGRTAPDFTYYEYEGGGHHPFTLAGSFDRTFALLARLQPPAAAARRLQTTSTRLRRSYGDTTYRQ